MKVATTLSGIIDYKRPGQGTSDIISAGFENAFLNFDALCSPYELENTGRPVIEQEADDDPQIKVSAQPSYMHKLLHPLLEKCGGKSINEKRINIEAAYAPYLPRETKHGDEINDLLKELTIESIKACAAFGCHYLIVRPLFAGIEPGAEFQANKEYYISLAETAKQNNVILLLENQCSNIGGHLVRGLCSDAQTSAEWIDSLNETVGEERFGFCMDTGICSICGQDMREFAIALGARIKVVILRECDGHNENSILPFTGINTSSFQNEWLNLIRGMREINFDGTLILEYAGTVSAFSPLLRPQLISLAKSVADYFKWQIEIEAALKKYKSIVLFGAGNMCRNYMKCYGEKYPPLFTCDNNKSLWGTSFCGLEVKPPEALRNLPEGCGIFICNIYYREIQKQLRGMEIENIEFFNDEYMPSFHFDRLKRNDEMGD